MRNYSSVGVSRKHPWLPLCLSAMMLLPVIVFESPSNELADDPDPKFTNSPDDNTYTLYFMETNETGTDGKLSTTIPEDGGQETESALDSDVVFMTRELVAPMDFFGRKFHSNDTYYLPVNVFLKATGPSNSNVDWTVSILTSDGTMGSTSWSRAACSTTFGTSCDFDYEVLQVGIGNSPSFRIGTDERLTIKIRASMSGCDSNNPFSSCEAEVAWNKISGDDRFSTVEVDSNALTNSVIMVQREGGVLAEGPEEDWFPNDDDDGRTMQFTIEAKSAFGRSDISRVELLMRDPEGTYRIDERITDDIAGISDTEGGIYGKYLRSYEGGLVAGEYSVILRITDIQGNIVDLEHDSLIMNEWGVTLSHRKESGDGGVEYFAPGQITEIPLQLLHKGSSTKSMSVELSVETELGSSWLIEFDSASNEYDLETGGSYINPSLILTAPSDLTGMPNKIRIIAVAEGDPGTGIVSQVGTPSELILDVEKIDVYQPPVVSIWTDDHMVPIANSSRGDAIDSSIPRFVEHESFNPFILEVFNTGFDADWFRIDVTQRSKALFQLHDNQTGSRILENEQDGTFHTATLERHGTHELILGVKPSLVRDDPDIAEITIEVSSGNNLSSKTLVTFTIQRTFGIQAEVSQDCDGTPMGHMKVSLCSDDAEEPSLSFRTRITNSMSGSGASNWWILQNPSSLDINTDRNPVYGQWQFKITDSEGELVPRVSLGPGDFTEVFVDVTLTNQVEVGNHTVYLRVMEETDDEEARYFDLPITFEVDADDPMLEIFQVSQNTNLIPSSEVTIQMKVKNKGNGPITVLLDADTDESGWSVEIGGLSGSPLIEIEAFDEEIFSIIIDVPGSANNGQVIPITITATPLDTDESFPESSTARFTFNAQVEIGGFLDIIANEINHPRPITLVTLVIAVLMLVAGTQGWVNRRRWSSQMAMIESLNEQTVSVEGSDPEIPTPVTSPTPIHDSKRYDEDDIELI